MDVVTVSVVSILFALVTGMGFVASRWRQAKDLNNLDEWALGGRGFGGFITWFFLGGDLYSAYTLIAGPRSAAFPNVMHGGTVLESVHTDDAETDAVTKAEVADDMPEHVPTSVADRAGRPGYQDEADLLTLLALDDFGRPGALCITTPPSTTLSGCQHPNH